MSETITLKIKPHFCQCGKACQSDCDKELIKSLKDELENWRKKLKHECVGFCRMCGAIAQASKRLGEL